MRISEGLLNDMRAFGTIINQSLQPHIYVIVWVTCAAIAAMISLVGVAQKENELLYTASEAALHGHICDAMGLFLVVFCGVFVIAQIAGTVRERDEDQEQGLPALTVIVALLLFFGLMGFFTFYGASMSGDGNKYLEKHWTETYNAPYEMSIFAFAQVMPLFGLGLYLVFLFSALGQCIPSRLLENTFFKRRKKEEEEGA